MRPRTEPGAGKGHRPCAGCRAPRSAARGSRSVAQKRAGCQGDDQEHHEERAADGQEDAPAHSRSGYTSTADRQWLRAARSGPVPRTGGCLAGGFSGKEAPPVERASSRVSPVRSAPPRPAARCRAATAGRCRWRRYHASLPCGTGARVKRTGACLGVQHDEDVVVVPVRVDLGLVAVDQEGEGSPSRVPVRRLPRLREPADVGDRCRGGSCARCRTRDAGTPGGASGSASSSRHEAVHVRVLGARAGASRTRRSRCSGTTGCCCPAACGASRRRPGSWACPGTAGALRGSSSPAGSAPPRSQDRRRPLDAVVGRIRSGVAPSALRFPVLLVVLARVAHQVVEREAVVGSRRS